MDAAASSTPEKPALDAALADFTSVLAADGYTSEWEVDGDHLIRFQIRAGEDACADCLVPKVVLESILNTALEGTGYRVGEVRLPIEAA